MKKYLFTVVAAVSLLAVPVAALAAAYKDVPAGHWARQTIEWGTTEGVVNGYPDGTFKPEKNVSEEEFLTMLISAYVKRSDLQGVATHWSDPFYYFAHDKNYPTEGWDEPTARRWAISRQRVADILSGASGVNYSGDNAIKWLLAKGLAKGKSTDVSVEGYKGADFLTRAEAIQFIKNAKENGLTELKVRPAQPSDPSLIPPLPGQTPPVTTGGNGTTVTVVPSSNPEFLLPKDSITEQSVQAFLDSLRYTDGIVTGTIPSLPSGYTLVLRYKDASDGKWGDRDNDRNFSSLKAGDSFSFPVKGKGGRLIMDVYIGNVGKNGVIVKCPEMTAEWGSKR